MARDGAAVAGWRYDPPLVFDRGAGVKVFDLDGRDFFDMSSGMMSLPLGHAHPEIVEVIRTQAERFVHQSSWYANPWAIELAEMIGDALPGSLQVVNFAVTGSEANEVAMRLALAATGKFDIVSVVRGLHGGSLAAESLTTVGGARRQGLGPLTLPAGTAAILPPFCYRCPVSSTYPACDVACLRTSEDLIEHTTSKSIAAIIAEPILVAGGMIVPPAEWLPRLKAIAERWGALLILDEAQLAPGRTGKFWGFQNYDVIPDIVTFGKGLGGGLAMCGAVTTPEIADRARGRLGLPWAGTFSADPLPSAVALKTLEVVMRDDLPARAARVGAHLRRRLEALRDSFSFIGDVRGAGLYLMLDIVRDPATKEPDPAMAERIRYNASREGVLLICVKNFIRLCPPLIVDETEIDEAIDRLERACQSAARGEPKDIAYTRSSSLAAGAQVISPAVGTAD